MLYIYSRAVMEKKKSRSVKGKQIISFHNISKANKYCGPLYIRNFFVSQIL